MAVAHDHDVAMVPGALTPTEIGTAWAGEGATAVKVFPIQSVGGTRYLAALAGPMGDIPLIPTGGVTCENAGTFLRAGAIAIGLSTDLFPKALIQSGDFPALEARIRNWLVGL